MGRKKKKENEEEEKANGKKRGRPPKNNSNGISSDTKRSIVAVFLIALAVLTVFSLFGSAGVFGTYLNKTLAIAFGIGRFLFPVLMALVGFLYFRKSTESYYVFVAAGFFIFFASILGIIHIFYALPKMMSVAKQGGGGGFLGAAAAYPALKYFGFWAGLIVLVALALASLLLGLNVPLRALLKPIDWLRESNGEEEDQEERKKEEDQIATSEEEMRKPALIGELIKKRPGKNNARKKNGHDRKACFCLRLEIAPSRSPGKNIRNC